MVRPSNGKKKKKRKDKRVVKVVTQNELMAMFYMLLVQLKVDGNPNEASFDEEILQHFPEGANITARWQEGRIYFHAVVPGEKREELKLLLPDKRIIL